MVMRGVLAACLIGAGVHAQVARVTPPRLEAGSPPALPALAVGGGQVLAEVSVGPAGSVTAVTPLRITPPFTAAVDAAARQWRFRAASETMTRPDGRAAPPKPVAGKVLVAAIFRAPTLVTPTAGEIPRDVAAASAEVPFPLATVEPGFPPQARSRGVVMIEVLVTETGAVGDTRVLASAPPFDQPALDAARQWRFRPARAGGRAGPSHAYLIFGFPEPVLSKPPPAGVQPTAR